MCGDVDFQYVEFKEGALFSGSEIQGGDFTNLSSSDTIEFLSNTFSKNVYLSSSDGGINGLKVMTNTFEENMRILDVTSEDNIKIAESEFKNRLQISNLTTGGDFLMPQTTVRTGFVIESANCTEMDLSGSQFHGPSSLSDIKCESLQLSGVETDRSISLSNSTLVEDLDISNSIINNKMMIAEVQLKIIRSNAANVDELHLHDSTIDELGIFDNSKIHFIHLDLNTPEEFLFVSMVDVHFEGGIIEHPESNYGFFDFTSAKLGDIDVHGIEEDPLSPFQFVETDFYGFDFTDFRQSLEKNNWEFDHAESEFPHDIQQVEADDDEVDTRKYPDLQDPIYSRETTYLKAKNGAERVGDQKSASEFLIKEMELNRKRQKIILKEDNLFKSGENNAERELNHQWTKAFSKFVINWVLYYSCGYGERISKIGVLTFASIMVPAILYPLTEGVLNTSTGNLISFQQSGIDINTLAQSLYFSIVTFTTLGYGDYYPLGTGTKIIAGIESILGVFLAGLFIYSLGKRVAR